MSVSAVYADDLSRVRITCTGAPAAVDFARIERSTDGITWATVRGADTVALVAGACSIDDYEFAPDLLNRYRASYVDTGPPSFVDVGAASTGNNTALAPALPAGVAAGDTLVLFAASRGAAATVDTPAGWTLWVDGGNVRVFTTLYTPGITAPSVGFTGGAVGDDTIARVAAFRNVGGAAWVYQVNASGQDIAVPALPVLAADTMLVRFGWKASTSTASTFAGWTQIGRTSSAAGSGATLIWYYLTSSVSVAASTITLTGGTAAVSEAATLRFERAAFVLRETATVTPVLSSVWLKNPQRPYLNRRLTVVDWSDVERPARAGVFDVVGRSYPVAVTELRGSRRYTLTVTTPTVQAAADLDACLSAGEPVLLHTPADCPFPGVYAVVGDTTLRRGASRRSPRRYLDLPLTEVAAPAGTLVGTTVTWAGVVSSFASWADVVTAEPSWSDVLDRIGTPADVVVP